MALLLSREALAVCKAPCAFFAQGPALYQLSTRLSVQGSFRDQLFISMQGLHGAVQGYLYQLDDHLDRFYISASKAALVPPFPRPQLRRIILETAAASQTFDGARPRSLLSFSCILPLFPCMHCIVSTGGQLISSSNANILMVGFLLSGSIRYWLGAGQGGFGISPLECLEPSFYCMVYQSKETPDHSKVSRLTVAA